MSALPDLTRRGAGVRKPAVGASSGAGRLHLRSIAAFAGALAATLAITTTLLAIAAGDPERGGRLIALYPPGWSAERVLAASVRADATLRAQGWWPGLVELDGAAGLAARLRAQGAVLVIAPLPIDLGALPGCTGVMRVDPARARPAVAL